MFVLCVSLQKDRCQTARRPVTSSKTLIPKKKSKPQECLANTDNVTEHEQQEIPRIEFIEIDKQIVTKNDNHQHGITNDIPAQSPSHACQQQIEEEFSHSLPILSKLRSSRSSSVATLASPTTTPIISIMSASSSFAWTRERALEQQIDNLHETLKDTEERLHSLRLQYDNVSQMHRSLRDTNHQMHEEMDRLKIDAQHLHECANILRTELQAARKDRADALELQAMLQRELDTSRQDKKRACDEVESNARQILDLQRQCKEMDRILARKNPDAMKSLLGMGFKFHLPKKFSNFTNVSSLK